MTPRQAFYQQRNSAKWRGIVFLFTFEEWWEIWRASGKWEQRGRKSKQYCMARFGDVGAYQVGNVCIKTNHENQVEVVFTPERCAKMGKGKWTPERRVRQAVRMREMVKRRWGRPGEKEKSAEASKQRWADPVYKKVVGGAISAALQARK